MSEIKHNHITRDIKPLGECPSCDKYHNRNIPSVCREQLESKDVVRLWNEIEQLKKEIEDVKEFWNEEARDKIKLQAKLETQAEIIEKLEELYKELCHEANVNHGYWLKKYKDKTEELMKGL